METAFQEQYQEAGRQNGAAGVLRLWWETIVGIFSTAPGEHLAMFRQDAGFALRMMRKSPGFTLAAILTLGLGIGANSAIFSVVNAVLLKPLPYEHGDRLVVLQQRMGTIDQRFSAADTDDYRRQSRALDGLVEYHNMNFILLGRSEPERVETGVVSWNFFDVFSVKPVFGRMKSGVGVRQAQADLSGVAANLEKAYPQDYPEGNNYAVETIALEEALTHNARPTMLVLLAAAGFVLLIACANVANLNLSRMVRRERELAVRAALGAGRVRMFRQLLTESFLLAVVGGGLGLLFSWGALSLLVDFAARFTPRAREIHMDAGVLMFTFLVAVLTSLLSGTAPALAARETVVGTLKEGGLQSTIGLGKHRLRSSLIVAQVAVSFLLLIGAGLMLRSFLKLQHVDPGFQPENVLTMEVALDFIKYDTNDKQRAFFETLLEKVQMQSGVKSAAASMMIPFTADMTMTGDFEIAGQGRAPGQAMPKADFRIVSPSFFEVLHIPIINGRGFFETDRPGHPDVAVVNRSAVSHLWGSLNPVGTRFSTDGGKTWTQVVGVVGDIKQYGLDKDVADEIYVPLAQNPMGQASLVIKTAVEPMSIAGGVIELLHGVDRNQPAARVRSLEQVRAESVAAPRLTTNLLGLFALLALAIAATGIGGVMALAVGQRRHEIGVRMAIGARPGEILRMILRQGMVLALVGVALGLFGALWLTRLLQQLLFEVTPTDPLTYLGVAVVLGLAALVACYVPARRASRVDPIIALRIE